MGKRACLFCPSDIETRPVAEQFRFWRTQFTVLLMSTTASLALSGVFVTAAMDTRDQIIAKRPALANQTGLLVDFSMAACAAFTALGGAMTLRRRQKMKDAQRILDLP